MIMPIFVAWAVSVGVLSTDALAVSAVSALARPKSSTFALPSGRILMFAGLRSR